MPDLCAAAAAAAARLPVCLAMPGPRSRSDGRLLKAATGIVWPTQMRRACLDELGAHANGLLAGHGCILIAQIGLGIAEGMLAVYMRIARGVCVADVWGVGSWDL